MPRAKSAVKRRDRAGESGREKINYLPAAKDARAYGISYDDRLYSYIVSYKSPRYRFCLVALGAVMNARVKIGRPAARPRAKSRRAMLYAAGSRTVLEN